VLVLAFDASTSDVAVAVARAEPGEPTNGAPREVLAEISVPSRGASEALLPAVHAALSLAGVTLGDVERVLVGVGPGTFTGIRIAAAAARSLAFSTGATLSTVSTLDALAAPALLGAPPPATVLAVLDARRRQVFARRYGEGLKGEEISCSHPDELGEASSAGGAALVVGDGAIRYRERLAGLGFIPPDVSLLHRVSGAGLLLASDLRAVPTAEVVPIYVREPDAEVRRDLNPWSHA